MAPDGDASVLAITDQGPGVAPEWREGIFERFGRPDSNVSGTGLGLYVARGLARALGGDLRAVDVPPVPVSCSASRSRPPRMAPAAESAGGLRRPAVKATATAGIARFGSKRLGARSGTRTRTPFRTMAFEAIVSTDSTIRAGVVNLSSALCEARR